MTKYKLPPLAGEMVAHHSKVDAGTEYAGFYVEGEIVWVPLSLLTEVKPPLPPEPPVGAVVRADFKAPDMPDIESWVFEHGEIPAPNGNSWCGAGRDEAFSWAEICALGTPIRLVPAPEPVELPWSTLGIEVDTAIGCGCHDQEDGARLVRVIVTPTHLTPDETDALAAALTTAATKAREATS